MANAHMNGTTKTPAQQAALNKMRKEKSIDIGTPAADHETLKGAQAEPNASYYQQLLASAKNFGIMIPSWKRSLLALVGSFCVGYAIGSIAAVMLDILWTAAITVTGSSFIATCVYVVGFIAALYCAIKAGQKVGMYIATGDIDQDISRAWNWTKGLFSTAPGTAVTA